MLFMIVNLSTAFTQLKYEIIYCVWYYMVQTKVDSGLSFSLVSVVFPDLFYGVWALKPIENRPKNLLR